MWEMYEIHVYPMRGLIIRVQGLGFEDRGLVFRHKVLDPGFRLGFG